jgi:hypothetical protein
MILLVIKEIKRRIFANEIFLCCEFDLTKNIQLTPGTAVLHLRTLKEQDIDKLFFTTKPGKDTAELKKRIECLFFINSRFHGCFVGADDNDSPIVICWLIEPSSNNELQSYFKKSIPLLSPDEVLFEFIFTHPDHRGNEMMRWLTTALFKKAKETGYKRAVAFVKADNTSSVEGSKNIGWKTYALKTVRWRLFTKKIEYKTISK